MLAGQLPPQPVALLLGQPTESPDDRQGELALLDVLPALLQVALEAAQVEHVVDDLERQADGFEEPAHAVDLRFAAAPEDGADASRHARRHGSFQAVNRQDALLELAGVSRL